MSVERAKEESPKEESPKEDQQDPIADPEPAPTGETSTDADNLDSSDEEVLEPRGCIR